MFGPRLRNITLNIPESGNGTRTQALKAPLGPRLG
ncbi:hypothetical protein SBA6_270034 [Candidatus Sulfopaludibacter sp. SbA6]|nr:hypothetical protein SBA6_270034 [Candidatus Sulfopaludibacter sp. SbA6]